MPCLKNLSPWLGRKHRDNTLTLKRFFIGGGLVIAWVVQQQKLP
ncbi:hypothetical protein ACVXHA_14140 [Escherichia coli]